MGTPIDTINISLTSENAYRKLYHDVTSFKFMDFFFFYYESI